MTRAIELIKRERARQIEKWGDEHDDAHGDGELAVVAGALAVMDTEALIDMRGCSDSSLEDWRCLAANHSKLRRLVIAGALIAAEIDKQLRFIQATAVRDSADAEADALKDPTI